jgi:Flp pilus assembly protein TadG
MSKRSERGTTTVEFAISGAVIITVILAVIELSRAMFMLSVLSEGTRRGARVAAVCPINDPAIAQTTRFANIPGLTTQNVAVEYLNQAGTVIPNPTGNFGTIEYVRVRIVNYQMQLWIPFVSAIFPSPQFAVTLPRESLGVPRTGVVTPC